MSTFPQEIERVLRCALAPDSDSPSGLAWKRPLANRVKARGTAGTLGKDGYWSVQVKGKKLAAHRVLWWLLNGEIPAELCIDHIDGNRGNNNPENLRLATRSQNNQNSRSRTKLSTLPKGISRAGCGYRAQVQGNGVRWRINAKDLSVLVPRVTAIREGLHNDFFCYR
ncbi:TPA: HNH endonuclease [Serratia marcescens]|uniref:HNH endonuclease n=1 Tax=Serratia TaxID=613 RepID=UPI00135CEFE7|nr:MULTISPECIES: HNH endonuclease [Serratia]QPJ88640.1 HNH endonuclease [Serratia marcescens]HAT3735758.1 HNH endonuclease [Serratia marcescens]